MNSQTAVAELNDPAVRAIDARRKAGEPISFAWFRQRFKAQKDGVQSSLGFGTAVLSDIDQMNQYLWSYAPMVASQWRRAADFLPIPSRPTRWIDYGCGQGLAGLLLRDIGSASAFEEVRHVLLIEPSLPALARAEVIYSHLAPDATVGCIAAPFDDVPEAGFVFVDGLDTIHIFSNVLDIPRFDALELFGKALQPGRHVIAVVSHDRDFDGGTERIQHVRAELEGPRMRSRLVVRRSHYELFRCDNNNEAPAVMWISELDVHG